MLGLKSRHALGFGMLFATILLWVGSSVALQTIFQSVEFHFEQPLFVTLFNSAMSSTLLLPHALRSCSNCLLPGSALQAPQGSESSPNQKERRSASDSSAGDSFLGVLSLSVTIGAFWLSAQCVFNFSLLYTSVATSTVLSSSSSVFTLIFSMLICNDSFKMFSFSAAITSVAGCAIVVLHSPMNVSESATTNSNLGNVLTLIAAALFAFVSVLIRKMAPPGFDLSKFLGMNGIISTCISPIVLYAAHQSGLESFRPPSPVTLAFLSLNALFGCTMANYLYTSAMLLLSPLVASVCMSLSIPVSAVVDEMLLQQHRFSTLWLCGAGLTASATVLAALDLEEEPHTTTTKESVALAALFGASWDEDSDAVLGRWPVLPRNANPEMRYRADSKVAQVHELRSLLDPEEGDGDSRELDDEREDWRDSGELGEADYEHDDELDDEHAEDKEGEAPTDNIRTSPLTRIRKPRSSFSESRRLRPRFVA